MEGSETAVTPVEGSQPSLTSQKGTYANVVQRTSGKKGLTKYEVEITMKDGVGSVEVPEDIFRDSSPLWEDFLIGRFMAGAPHIAKVHAIVNKIWNHGDKSQMIDVFEINSTSMKFRICNPDTRLRILRRGMWNLAGLPVVMAKWKLFEEEEKAEETSIPLWVHMKNVPRDMFSWKGLSFVASPTGVPDRLHPETAQCLNMKVAKIFFKTDLTKELPKSLVFNFHGKATKVEYFYPWLPKSCLVNANNPNKNNGERSDSLEKDTNVTDTQKELETQSVGEEREKREDTNNMATETEKEEPQVVEKEVSKMQTLSVDGNNLES